MALVLGEHIEQLRGRTGDIRLAQAPRDRGLKIMLHPCIVERGEAVGRQAHDVARHRFRVIGADEPAVERARRPKVANPLHHRRARQEVRLDEMRQARGDALLVARNDRGVRNETQAKRMVKKRGHREPVGDRPDHRRLGGDRDPVEPGILVLEGLRARIEPAGEDEQASRAPFHARKPRVAFCFSVQGCKPIYTGRRSRRRWQRLAPLPRDSR